MNKVNQAKNKTLQSFNLKGRNTNQSMTSKFMAQKVFDHKSLTKQSPKVSNKLHQMKANRDNLKILGSNMKSLNEHKRSMLVSFAQP